MDPGKQTQQTSYMQKDLQQNQKNPERIADQRATLTETASIGLKIGM